MTYDDKRARERRATDWTRAAKERQLEELRRTLERCARSGRAYEVAHFADSFSLTAKDILKWAGAWGLSDVFRNALPTHEESLRIVVPGRQPKPIEWAFRAYRGDRG